jgi:hypothetical protein
MRAGRLPLKLRLALLVPPVLAVLVVGFLVMRGAGPEQVARRFILAETRADYPAMLALLPSADAAKVRAELGGKLPESIPNAQLPEVTCGKAWLRGPYAIVPLTREFEKAGEQDHETPRPEQVVLVREHGQWKVDLAVTDAANSSREVEMGEDQPGSGPLQHGGDGD